MIPKFDIYHTSLHSSYISFDNYKKFLGNFSFSGYIHLYNKEVQCFYFIKEGKDAPCLTLKDGRLALISPREVIPCFKKPFFLSTYKCPDSYIGYFSRIHSTTVIYENISIDTVDLPKLLGQVETKKITGFLESWKEGDKKRYIYFYNGKILGYLNIRKQDGFFEKRLDKADVQTSLRHSTVNIHNFSSAAGAGDGIEQPSDTSSPHSLSLSGQQKLDPPPPVDEKRLKMLKCYEEIFNVLEEDISHGEFDSIWRNCAMELSEEYAFLNPFAGEFSYSDGQIDLWEQVDAAVAANAMEALSNLIAKRANLPKDGIKAVKNNYIDILVAYEIRN